MNWIKDRFKRGVVITVLTVAAVTVLWVYAHQDVSTGDIVAVIVFCVVCTAIALWLGYRYYYKK